MVLLSNLLLIFDLDIDWFVGLHLLLLLLLLLHHFLLLLFINYLTTWSQGLHTVTTCSVTSHTALIEHRLLGARWHLSNLAFELQVLAPIAVESLHLDRSLLVE